MRACPDQSVSSGAAGGCVSRREMGSWWCKLSHPLSYLRACVSLFYKTVLRRYQLTLPPTQTTVSVSPWAATHLPINFSEPLSFIPERWIDSPKGRFASDNRQASQPFSYGPRGCIGKNLAYIEQRLLICHLLWNFDLEAPGGPESKLNEQWSRADDMKNMKAFLVWVKPDLWVRLKRVAR